MKLQSITCNEEEIALRTYKSMLTKERKKKKEQEDNQKNEMRKV